MAATQAHGPSPVPDRNGPEVRFLAAVILEAWVKADRVADLLTRINGQQRRRPDPPTSISLDSPTDPMADVLSDLGAAIRIADWERAGLRPKLPSDLPTGTEALAAVRMSLQGGGDRTSGQLTRIQLDVWLTHFAWSAAEQLGVDVIIDTSSVDRRALIEELAAFLWKYRHLNGARGNADCQNEK